MTSSPFSKLIPIVSAALVLLSCSESPETIADRVFNLAREQVLLMDGRLNENTAPRTFENGQAMDASLRAWTSGFFPGTAWYVYEYTGDERVREVAERRTRELAALPSFNVGHDIGFMIGCSYGNAFRITRDTTWLPVISDGAANLAARFNPMVGCTLSWGQFKDSRFTVIIDNMMNLELLTSAARLFGADSLLDIAKTHAFTTMKNHFRDASAAAIMASAFAEMHGLTSDASLSRGCLGMALRQVRTLASEEYLAESGNGNFLLRHCVGNLPSKGEIDVPLTYADYYFLEALMRLVKKESD